MVSACKIGTPLLIKLLLSHGYSQAIRVSTADEPFALDGRLSARRGPDGAAHRIDRLAVRALGHTQDVPGIETVAIGGAALQVQPAE